ADTRVVSPNVEHPESAKQVQISVAFRVVEVLALRAGPDAIEADRLQHTHELRVDRPCVERVLLARTRLDQFADHRRSVSPPKRREPRGCRALGSRDVLATTCCDPCRGWTCRGSRHAASSASSGFARDWSSPWSSPW